MKDSKDPATMSGIKLGLLAVSSAVVGGLAAAWWHRRTLAKLQNPILSDETDSVPTLESQNQDPDFREY